MDQEKKGICIKLTLDTTEAMERLGHMEIMIDNLVHRYKTLNDMIDGYKKV